MKFSVNKNELLRLVSFVGKLSTTRATLPILQNILIETKSNTLILRSTDLEQTLEAEINCEGFEDGRTTVSARLLTDYLQNNTDEKITITSEDTLLKVDSKNHHAQVKTMPADDFPVLPKIKFDHETVLPSEILGKTIDKVIFASASDDTRPILTGLLFRFSNNSLELVSTDGYRLAYIKIPTNDIFTGDYIIPKRSLLEIQRLLAQGDEVILSLSSNQLQVKSGAITFTSRVLEGAYPPFESRIPKEFKLSIGLNGSVLNQTLKLASIFSRDSAFSTKFELDKNILKVTAISPVLGENINEVAVDNPSGNHFTVSVNAQYFIDALATLSGDAQLNFIDSKSPVVLRSPSDKDYLYLVMPLRSE